MELVQSRKMSLRLIIGWMMLITISECNSSGKDGLLEVIDQDLSNNPHLHISLDHPHHQVLDLNDSRTRLEDEHVTVHYGSPTIFTHINTSLPQFRSSFWDDADTELPALNRSSGTGSEEFLILPKKLMQDCFTFATQDWVERQELITNAFSHNAGADSKSPVGTAFAFNPPNMEAIALANTSILLEFASREFLKQLDHKSEAIRRKRQAVIFSDEETTSVPVSRKADVREFLNQNRPGSMSSMTCGIHDEVLPCNPKNPYRTYTGWCNNVKNPGWGKSVVTFDRMLPSVYADGVSLPKSASAVPGGRALPSPRHVSDYVHIDSSHLSTRHTLMLMQYAQFLDHDLTLTPVHKGPEEKILNCRDCESGRKIHPECWPIPVPTGDSWYPATHTDTGRPYCIPFTRSLPGQQRLGPREQINQNSAYIDASQIYGENVCKSETLRVPGGKLNVTKMGRGKPLMPQTSFLRECKSHSGYCFYAGDPRASEHPALATVHTMFLRQHNQWATDFKAINPHWKDEKIYQEVRRIMGAVNQHITYNELLTRILGPSMVEAYGLRLQGEGYYAGYDPSCSANIFNEFSTAAFRFGHSLIRPQLARMDHKYHGLTPHIQLRDAFFDSDMLYKPLMVDEVIRGLLAEPMEQVDPFITNEITNHLFEDKKKAFSGMDLIALNTHRGRDHGLPGYNSYRAVCSLKKATNFQDLSNEIPADVLERLAKVYAHVDDIDLFTGSLVERPVKGGILGPVMTCIIGSQFKRLRQCDRFWYETNDAAIRFTPQQLAEIRKITLSKIVCDNLDVPTDTQRWAMDAPHNALNPRLPCGRLASLNLKLWRESPESGATTPTRPIVNLQSPNPAALVMSYSKTSTDCTIGGKKIEVGGSGLQSPCVSCVCTSSGSKCRSLRITSCGGLLEEARREEILKDPVCTSQCGLFLQSSQPLYTNRIVIPSARQFG